MSVADLVGVLDGLEDASCCSGTHRVAERVAIALPDGDVGAVDDAKFVEWLLEHAEPAPYGDGTTTKVDPKVRSAQRLVARGAVQVHGFEPSAILDEIEATLSPTRKLSAHLTDVIVYKKGDKFTRHKDTPRAAELIGTLVVGLPVAHTGGAFVVDDGRGAKKFDWGKPEANTLPWVALFSDVDHEIEPVKSGARVTLVYALHRTDEPRVDAKAKARQEMVKRLAGALSKQATWPVMIVCNRQVIAEPGAEQPQSIDTLRGADRDVAEALVEAGYHVGVRACMAAIPNYNDPPRWPATEQLWTITRLKAAPPAEILENMTDEGAAADIEDYILDSVVLDQCAIRKNAAATLLHENACWAEEGMAFGNEGYEALLYTLAALEVTKDAPKKPKAKPAAKTTTKAKAAPAPKKAQKAKAKPAAKPKAKAKAKPKAKAKAKR